MLWGPFAVENMLLKYKRSHLQRQVCASWGVNVLALALVIIGLVGVIVHDTSVLSIWLLYFVMSSRFSPSCFCAPACYGLRIIRCKALLAACALLLVSWAQRTWVSVGSAMVRH